METEPWAYDLVLAVEKYEEAHDSEAICLKDALGAVPPEVRREAYAIRAYLAGLGRKPYCYPPCVHRPSASIDYHTPCGQCVHQFEPQRVVT